METALDDLVSVLYEDLPARFARAQDLARDSAVLAETFEAWLTFWRDVLLQQTGNVGAMVNLERRELLQLVGTTVDVATTLRILTELEGAQEAVLANANAQLLVENLLLELPTLVD